MLAGRSRNTRLVGVGFAWFVYGSGRVDWIALRARLAGPKRLLERGFYVDDVYGGAFAGPGRLSSAFLGYVVERRVIDGFWEGLASLVGLAASGVRWVQSGLVRAYALAFLLGAVGVLGYIAVRIH